MALAMTPFRALSIVLACGGLACSSGKAVPAPATPPGTPAATAAATATTTATATATAAPAKSDSLLALADKGRVLGAESAPLWLLIVSDFQCPYCKMWHDSTFSALKREYVDAGKVRMAYINFPLGIHANSWPSAMAAMCASAQGKFWETQDRIFQTQRIWEKLAKAEPYLDSLAIASGADAVRQHACSQNRSMQDLIAADQTRANKAGAETTPTFFIGGAKIEGAQPTRLFRHVIDSLLAAGARNK